jgi:RNA polymerase sigma-70 factor, ECF subfamily
VQGIGLSILDLPPGRALSAERPREEDGLAERAVRGDRSAFARLYERFSPAVHGVLLASGPREDASDLVQEVFLLALRSIGRLEDPASFGPWLLAIARNRARDAHKSRRVSVELPDELESVVEESPDDEADHALETVRGLPEAYRETLILRLVEGLSGPEIAERTGLTHGSVRVNLCRGMKLLRERLARPGGA